MRDSFKNFGPLIMQETLARGGEEEITALKAARGTADAIAKTIKFPEAIIARVIERLKTRTPAPVRGQRFLCTVARD